MSASEGLEVIVGVKELKTNEAMADQNNSDDSNSEIASVSTATDSVGNYTNSRTYDDLSHNNVKMCEEDNEKKAMRFIDFLGVGVTNS